MHSIRPIGAPALPNSMQNMTNNILSDPTKFGTVPPRPYRFRNYRQNPNRDYTMKSAKLSLEEAAKLEVQRQEIAGGEPKKTAVNIIQELLSRRGTIKPDYEMLDVEGSFNVPLFKFQIVLESGTKKYIGQGNGRSKKEAKRNAAKSALNQLLGIKDDPTPVLAPKTVDNSTKPSVNGVSDKSFLKNLEPNPVSKLQETCYARKWPPPYYENEEASLLPRDPPNFTTYVYVNKYRECGQGKNKKIAKREAAKKMVKVLEMSPNVPFDYKKLFEDANTSESLKQELSTLKGASYNLMTPPQTKKIAQFHQKLKNNKGAKLEQLKTNISNIKGFDAVAYLEEIGKEQRFEITFVEIEDKALSGNFQALVQLATFPVAVCHGEGKTQKDAKVSAAHNAIEYLRLMTKSK